MGTNMGPGDDDGDDDMMRAWSEAEPDHSDHP